MADALNAPMTASVQWLERSLDDSANRRISLPEGFLCADAVLIIACNVASGLRVNEKVIESAVMEYLPFIATENIMMEAVKRGGDRQELHEIIRGCTMKATARMKNGEKGGLIELLSAEPKLGLKDGELNEILEPSKYIGRCSQQVEEYLNKLKPIIAEASGESVLIEI